MTIEPEKKAFDIKGFWMSVLVVSILAAPSVWFFNGDDISRWVQDLF